MKRIIRSVFALVAMVVTLQLAAHAALISGSVTAVNAEAKQVTVAQTDAETGATLDKVLTVSAETKLSGVDALEAIMVGDKVSAEVSESAEGENVLSVDIAK